MRSWKKMTIVAVWTAFVFGGGYAVAKGTHGQIHKAEKSLGNAIKHLEAAHKEDGSHFGGHRAKALELAKQSRGEAKEAIKFIESQVGKGAAVDPELINLA